MFVDNAQLYFKTGTMAENVTHGILDNVQIRQKLQSRQQAYANLGVS